MQGDTYAVLISRETYQDAAWRKVAETLLAKYPDTQLILLDKLEDCAQSLRDCSARYAAFVAKPEELDYRVVNAIHRATRQVDDDLWGDCMWGIISAADVASAQRMAEATEPLIIKTSLSTTGLNTKQYEKSVTISDGVPYDYLSQKGEERVSLNFKPKAEDGSKGMQMHFVDGMADIAPDMVTTSAHATEYNLEMPFSLGLIFSYGNRFYQLEKSEMREFGPLMAAARKGDCSGLQALSEKYAQRLLPPDGHTRVWFAVGNCLFGNMNRSAHSMAATALGAYGCNQLVGYTVPSWYGKGGWDALADFTSTYEGISLSTAWYLNNQFILDSSLKKDPLILKAEFNEPEIGRGTELRQALVEAGVTKLDKDSLGLLHDRDVVALYGDPLWRAQLESERAQQPLVAKMLDPVTIELSAKVDYEGRFSYWYPQRREVNSCNVEGAQVTNDFILVPHIKLAAGEKLLIHLQ